MANEINEKTKLPLSFVAVAVPIIAVSVLYVAAISYTALNAERVNDRQDIQIEKNRLRIDDNQEKVQSVLYEINGRTIRIEEYLKHRGEK